MIIMTARAMPLSTDVTNDSQSKIHQLNKLQIVQNINSATGIKKPGCLNTLLYKKIIFHINPPMLLYYNKLMYL